MKGTLTPAGAMVARKLLAAAGRKETASEVPAPLAKVLSEQLTGHNRAVARRKNRRKAAARARRRSR